MATPFFTDGTIDQLRALHQTAMMDECELLKYTPGGPDPYGMPEPDNYTYLAILPCSYRPIRPGEALQGTDVPLLDALVSFDSTVEAVYDISLDDLDRIKITRLHGDLLAEPMVFEVVGALKRDNVAVIATLKKVTDG